MRFQSTSAFCLRAAAVFTTMFVIGFPRELSAQYATLRPAGVRVRVQLRNPPPKSVAGVLANADSMGFTIADSAGASTFIPAANVKRLDQYATDWTLGEAFWEGSIAGGKIGLALSAALIVAGIVADRQSAGSDSFVSATALAVYGSVPVTMTTGLIGGIVGLGRRKGWQQVSLYPWRAQRSRR